MIGLTWMGSSLVLTVSQHHFYLFNAASYSNSRPEPHAGCSRSHLSYVRKAVPRLVLRQMSLDLVQANPRHLDGLSLWRRASSTSFRPSDGQFAWQIPRHLSRPSGSPPARRIQRETATKSPLVLPIISSLLELRGSPAGQKHIEAVWHSCKTARKFPSGAAAGSPYWSSA